MQYARDLLASEALKKHIFISRLALRRWLQDSGAKGGEDGPGTEKARKAYGANARP